MRAPKHTRRFSRDAHGFYRSQSPRTVGDKMQTEFGCTRARVSERYVDAAYRPLTAEHGLALLWQISGVTGDFGFPNQVCSDSTELFPREC
jgi:hypothetical protein